MDAPFRGFSISTHGDSPGRQNSSTCRIDVPGALVTIEQPECDIRIRHYSSPPSRKPCLVDVPSPAQGAEVCGKRAPQPCDRCGQLAVANVDLSLLDGRLTDR